MSPPTISKLDAGGAGAAGPGFTFRIAPGAVTPIYRQMTDQVTLAVAAGGLAAGARMPSVRAVAEALLINPNTVARAYGDLTQAGVLIAQPGRGVFVAEAAADAHRRYSDEERRERLRRAVEGFVREVALLGFEKRELLAEVERALGSLAPGGGENAEAAGENRHG